MDSVLPIFAAMILALAAVAVLGYEGGLFTRRPATPVARTDGVAVPPRPVVASRPLPPVTRAAELTATPAPPPKSSQRAPDPPSALPSFPMSAGDPDAFAKTAATPVDALLPKSRRVGGTSAARTAKAGGEYGVRPSAYATGLDGMGLSIQGDDGPRGSASLLDAPSDTAAPVSTAVSPSAQDATRTPASPSSTAALGQQNQQTDLFSDPLGDTSAKPSKTPPKHPKIFDASENTPMDPLKNKSFDLNSGKSVPDDLVR